MNDRDIARLALCNLFRRTPLERFAELVSEVRWRDHQYRRGGLILLQGCVYSSLYILLEGTAYAEMSDDEGRCIRVETFSPVEALASAVLFAPKPVLPVTVGAQTDCRIVSFPKEEILKLCMKDKGILEAFLAEGGVRIQFLSERLRLTRFSTLRQRIADWLLQTAQSSTAGSPGSLPSVRVEPSFQKVADLMGVERPSLSRELSRMRREGLIDVERRIIHLKNIEALRQIRSAKKSRRLP